METKGRWILKTNDGRYLRFADYVRKAFTFTFTDRAEEALHYPALVRAEDDRDFFNNRGDSKNRVRKAMDKELGRDLRFEVVELALSPAGAKA